MAYNTNTYFVLFLPLAMALYQLTPKKYRYMALLVDSITFFLFIQASKRLIVWALITTAITFVGGVVIERFYAKYNAFLSDAKEKGIEVDKKISKKIAEKKAHRILIMSIFGVVAILVGLKYTNFTIETISSVVKSMGGGAELAPIKILVPIGISFYTLQSVGYLLDVYWKRIPAEHNFFKFSLFMLFFPTVMEGPICRYSDVKEQLFQGKPITEEGLVQGFLRIVWGLNKRMLIADRLNTAVNTFYNTDYSFNGLMIFITMIVTTIQLYMEFSGTIDIVIGSARIFNVKLPENFRQPFLAGSAAEFWRRWHISLGTWFKNYIFYPVSTSSLIKKWTKYGRKHAGKYITTVVTSAICLFPVWILNGIWHGPKVPYIMYGIYYFVILLAEIILEPAGEKLWSVLKLNPEGRLVGAIRMVRTWVVILVGEVLFRAVSLEQFVSMMKKLFVGPLDGGFMAGRILEVGLDVGDFIVILVGIVIVFIVEMRLEKDPLLFEKITKLPTPKRWSIYYTMIMSIVIFGAYGAGYQPVDLIYAGF